MVFCFGTKGYGLVPIVLLGRCLYGLGTPGSRRSVLCGLRRRGVSPTNRRLSELGFREPKHCFRTSYDKILCSHCFFKSLIRMLFLLFLPMLMLYLYKNITSILFYIYFFVYNTILKAVFLIYLLKNIYYVSYWHFRSEFYKYAVASLWGNEEIFKSV